MGFDFQYLKYHKNSYNVDNDYMFLKYELGHAQINMAEDVPESAVDVLTLFPINEWSHSNFTMQDEVQPDKIYLPTNNNNPWLNQTKHTNVQQKHRTKNSPNSENRDKKLES